MELFAHAKIPKPATAPLALTLIPYLLFNDVTPLLAFVANVHAVEILLLKPLTVDCNVETFDAVELMVLLRLLVQVLRLVMQV